jgi:hypothetical protein
MANLPPTAAITEQRFGGATVLQEQVLTVDNTVRVRLPNNPNRLRIVMLNEGAFDVRVSNYPDVNNSTGWLLAAAGGVITSDWSEDGEAVTYEWYLINVASSGKVRIREVVRS